MSHAPQTTRTSVKKKSAKLATMTTKRLRSAWSDVGLSCVAVISAMRPIWHLSPTATTIAVPEPSVTAAPMKAMLRASSEFLTSFCAAERRRTGSASPVSMELSTCRGGSSKDGPRLREGPLLSLSLSPQEEGGAAP